MNTGGYQILMTADGSPSLVPSSPQGAESMHNKAGAFTETQFVYGSAIERAIEMVDPRKSLRILSVGLGLAYVEFTAAALAIKHKRNITITSLESDSYLKTQLSQFLKQQFCELAPTYQTILDHFPNGEEVRRQLTTLYVQGEFRLGGKLDPHQIKQLATDYHCICFDAYSSNTSPELWEEEFLMSFLQNLAGTPSVFSTYACTGALKRALKAQAFAVTVRAGFHKRQSVFAVRS